jgi:hypothetical protein
MTISLKTFGLAAAVTLFSAGSALAAVATTTVNVRSGPGTGYGVVDVLNPGEYVSIRDQSGGWCDISHSGPDGWVSCAYLTGGPGIPVEPPIAVYPQVRIAPPFFYPHHFHHHYYPRPGFSFGFGGPWGFGF